MSRRNITAESLGIRKTSRIIACTVAVPKGGLSRTRMLKTRVSLAAISILDNPDDDIPPSALRRRRR